MLRLGLRDLRARIAAGRKGKEEKKDHGDREA